MRPRRGHIRQRGQSWCYVIKINGKQEWRSFPTKEEAEMRMRLRLASMEKTREQAALDEWIADGAKFGFAEERINQLVPTINKGVVVAASPTIAEESNGKGVVEEDVSIFTQIETVTPAMAELWLATSTYNRSISKKRVERYARSMLLGEWKLTGEPIIFTEDGALAQGHHRCHACILANTPFQTLVVKGAKNEVRIATDTGKAWTFADHLTAEGEADAKSLAGAVLWVWRYKQNDLRRQTHAPEPQELLRCLTDNPGIRDTVLQGKRISRKCNVSANVAAGAHYIAETIDKEDADHFFNRLEDGASLEHGSPILTLRDWVPTIKKGDAIRVNVRVVSALTIKTWNAYRDGDTLTKLTWRQGGSHPEPFPIMR